VRVFMRASSRGNSEFIEHLSAFLRENQNEAEAIKTLVNAPIEEKNQGKWERIFDSMDICHLFSDDSVKKKLVQSYENIYQYKDKDRSAHAKKFLLHILENYAFPDLENMDAVIKVLGCTDENYARKTQDEKIQIAASMIRAYLFYFFSAVFIEFSKRHPDDENLESINFEAIQKELVTAENFKGAANLQTYLNNEEKAYTGFVFAHRCILGLAKEHGLPGWNHERALCDKLLTMLFDAHPDLPQKLQACEGGYHLMGKNHLDAFEALIPAHLPEKRPAFFK
jgi:hypothetical protein